MQVPSGSGHVPAGMHHDKFSRNAACTCALR
jgi:hypothetical protein